jgi:signal transduction histidine kinase
MLLNARQVYNTRHEPQLILLAIEDVTERKQVEENIRALNAELETRVQQRTAELELVNQDLKHFIYAASHDLKTPLRGVSQIAYWLVEDYGDVFDTHGKEMLALQIDRVKRAYDLLDGILEYSSIGHALEEKACVPLQPLVMDVIQMLAPSEGIHIEIEHALPVIAGERKSLKKVFYHLLKNAIHVVDDTDGEITIRYADEKTHWKFDIVDNGPGIDEKYHEKIFQFFQTVDAHTGQRGLGIGLALVKKIIQLHGGEIGVTSMVGQGCEFSFTLVK